MRTLRCLVVLGLLAAATAAAQDEGVAAVGEQGSDLVPAEAAAGGDQLSTAEDADEAAEPVADPPPTQHRYFSRFSGFEPLYGSLGWRDQLNAKVQISFKYRFLNIDPDRGVGGNWFNKLYFGYSQTSLWELGADSAPFYDTSYKPSLFFLHEDVGAWTSPRLDVNLQTGAEHESNGQGGGESRSLNIVYLKPILTFGEVLGGYLTVAPKLYVYLGGLSDNRDIADYRGYVDLELAWKDPNGWKFAALLRKGTASSYGSVQLDASYPLDRVFRGSFDAFAHMQFFSGWGESLRSYNEKLPAQFRVGLMLVR